MLAVLKGLRTLTLVDPPKEPWRSRVEGATAAAAASSTPPGVLGAMVAGVLVEGMTRAVLEGVEGGWCKFANGVGGDEGEKDILLKWGMDGARQGFICFCQDSECVCVLCASGARVIVTETQSAVD